MKRQLIKVEQEFAIECDNVDCNYKIPYSESFIQDSTQYIDKPCPNCGENLLTKEDYLLYRKFIKTINWINKWFSWLTIFIPEKTGTKNEQTSVKIHDGIKFSGVKTKPSVESYKKKEYNVDDSLTSAIMFSSLPNLMESSIITTDNAINSSSSFNEGFNEGFGGGGFSGGGSSGSCGDDSSSSSSFDSGSSFDAGGSDY